MTYFSTISSKGQVTLPKDVRERMGLEAGDEIMFTTIDDGVLITAKSTNFNDLAGLLGRPPKGPATLAEIDETVAREAGRAASEPLTRRKGQAA